ncbi:MAG: serine/threonine protein kinase [Lachnospiraceae bacterium]|nr:serine/threonine protein kinase [Lachnospiraceae bacterium]
MEKRKGEGEMPDRIGRYRLLHELGKGGMSDVWLAEHEELHACFAMKIAFGAAEGRLRKLLRGEAERMKGIHDPRIPYLADLIEEDGLTALVMEYVDGITLERYIRKNAPMDEKEALAIMKRLCGITAFLHAERPQILYRDIKPSNFMIGEGGEIRLLDFGTALLERGCLRKEEAAGTAGYAPPEQLRGERVRADADVYALGAVYSYMLSGTDPAKPPFRAAGGKELGRMVSRGAGRLIDDCLSADPDRRPADASVLLERLGKLHPERESLLARAEGTLYRAALWINILFASVLVYFRYYGHPMSGAEKVCAATVLAVLVWGMIRERFGTERAFILSRSWNIVFTEKEGIGLPET